MVKKATSQHHDADRTKIIIANKTSFKGAFIDEGKLGLGESDKYYILGDHLPLILKMLNFGIMSIISQYTKYNQDFLNSEAFSFIPDLRKLGITDITEDAFYHLVGVSPPLG